MLCSNGVFKVKNTQDLDDFFKDKEYGYIVISDLKDYNSISEEGFIFADEKSASLYLDMIVVTAEDNGITTKQFHPYGEGQACEELINFEIEKIGIARAKDLIKL